MTFYRFLMSLFMFTLFYNNIAHACLIYSETGGKTKESGKFIGYVKDGMVYSKTGFESKQYGEFVGYVKDGLVYSKTSFETLEYGKFVGYVKDGMVYSKTGFETKEYGVFVGYGKDCDEDSLEAALLLLTSKDENLLSKNNSSFDVVLQLAQLNKLNDEEEERKAHIFDGEGQPKENIVQPIQNERRGSAVMYI